MDPFEEFEMKPITEGLGFHKKAVNLKDQVKKSELFEDGVGRSIPTPPPEDLLAEEAKKSTTTIDDLLASLEMPKVKRAETAVASPDSAAASAAGGEVKITEPLPRRNWERPSSVDMEIPQPHVPPAAPETDISRDWGQRQRSTSIPQPSPSVGVRRGAADSPSRRLVPASMSVASVLLDALVVLALALLFLVSLLLVTKVDLFSVLANAQNDIATQVSMGVLYLAVLEIYVVISRSFFGRTLAEWTFDLQMGDDRLQKKGYYPVLVLWRSLVVVGTGLVVLPLLSLIFRKDIASYLTGLQLYRKKR